MSKLTDKIEALHEDILADVRELEQAKDWADHMLNSLPGIVAMRQVICRAKREAYEHALAMTKANVSMVNRLAAAIAALDTEEKDNG